VNSVVPLELVEQKILLIRGLKVMLSVDLARLYSVETRALNQAVKRNRERFPKDFMFPLTTAEAEALVSQNVIPHKKYFGGAQPYAFTEQGVAMLSSVLKSKRAIQVNVAIMRTFVKLREMMATHKDLARQLKELEKKYDGQFQIVFDAIRQLITTEEAPKRKIGFIAKENRAIYRTSGKRAMSNRRT